MNVRFRQIAAAVGLLLALPCRVAIAQIVLPAKGYIETVAGNGAQSYAGDGSQAMSAQFRHLAGIAVDGDGNVYIADQGNQRIRKITAATGVITTVAGNGVQGYAGDKGPAEKAELNEPTSVTLDAADNIYIADSGNARIRKISAATGVITTVAGNGTTGYSGDGSLAIQAELSHPSSVALGGFGVIYIADGGNQRIRKVMTATGVISTVAGNGTAGYEGDGGVSTDALLSEPMGLAIDPLGNLFFADRGNGRIREIAFKTGTISTVAGSSVAGFSGDTGKAIAAELNGPTGVVLDAMGNLYIADSGNARIRKVKVSSGIITTLAGDGRTGSSGDGGPSADAEVVPAGLAWDVIGNLYIADAENGRVRLFGGDYRVGRSVKSKSRLLTPDTSCPSISGSAYTNLPYTGGTWTLTYYYEAANNCVPNASSNESWLGFLSNTSSCTPNPQIPPDNVTCTVSYQVLQNNAANRTATISLIDGDTYNIPILQYGTPEKLSVGVSGSGTVSSSPAGISCPSTCSASFSDGAAVSLSATPASGYSFSGWSGACSGTGNCAFTISGATNVSASFTAVPGFTIAVTNPSQQTPLSLGHSMTYNVTVSPTSGFTGAVALSTIDLPAGFSVTFSPTTIMTSGSAKATVTAAYSKNTNIGQNEIEVTGKSGSLNGAAVVGLTSQPLQYKGDCGVQ